MTNVYLEKAARIVEKRPGVRHEVGTSNFFVDRSKAEEWIKPHDDNHMNMGRVTMGITGALAGAAMSASKDHWKKIPIAAGIGGLVGVGAGHLMAKAGLKQDREYQLRSLAERRLSTSYDWELSYAKRNGGTGNPNVTLVN